MIARPSPSFIVKVCGLRRREDALAAVEAGANALGFVFYPQSPRYIRPEEVPAIADGLNAAKVGIFVDEPEERIEAAAQAAQLDIVQLYGTAVSARRRWRSIRVGGEFDPAAVRLDGAEAILLDSLANGQSFSWPLVRKVAAPVILAGGLDGANVAEAIRQAAPVGVDASSRLEIAPGKKDHRKVEEFVKAALAAAQVVTE